MADKMSFVMLLFRLLSELVDVIYDVTAIVKSAMHRGIGFLFILLSIASTEITSVSVSHRIFQTKQINNWREENIIREVGNASVTTNYQEHSFMILIRSYEAETLKTPSGCAHVLISILNNQVDGEKENER